MSKVKVLSLFSGAGGLDLGLERAGMEVVALCEIDPKARAVLRKHWPDTRIYDDVREVNRERLESDGIVHPHFVAGGSPCQDLSVAGKRRGLDGSRSGLFWEQCRIADELEADILWENVPGALSSNNGADFAAVLWGITGALVELPDGQKWSKAGVLVGPKRTAVWRVADAQRFGVPQRRRRIYVVGCSGAVARRLAPLLLEFTGGEGNRASGREAGTRAARTAPDGSDDAGGPRAGRPDGHGLYGTDRTGVTGAAYSTGTGWWNDADGKAGTLRAAGHPHEANLLAAEMRNGTVNGDVVQTLLAHKNGWSVNDLPMVLQEERSPDFLIANIRSGTLNSESVSTLMASFAESGSPHAMPIVLQEPQAFVKAKRASSVTDDDTWREEPVSPTLNVFDNGSDTRSTVLFVQPVNDVVSDTDKVAHALTASSSKGTTEDGTGRRVPIVSQPSFRMLAFGHYVEDDHASALKARDHKDATDLVVTFAQADQPGSIQVAQAPTGETTLAAPLGGAGATGGFRFDLKTCGAYVVVTTDEQVAKTLTTSNQRLDPGVETFVVVNIDGEVSKTLTTAQRLDPEVETFVVAAALTGEVAKTLTTSNQRLNADLETFVVQQPLAFTVKGNGEAWVQDMVTGITTGGGLPGQGYPAVIQPTETYAFQPADQTLGKGALRAVRTDVAPTIALGDHHSDRGLRIVQEVTPVAFSAGNSADAYGLAISEDLTPPLRAGASGTNQVPTVVYQDSQFGVAGYDTAGTLRSGRIPDHQMLLVEVPDDAVSTPAVVRMREGAPGGGKGPLVSEQVSLTLATGNDQILFQPVAFTQNQREEVRDLGMVASALSAEGGTHQQTYIAMTVPVDEDRG